MYNYKYHWVKYARSLADLKQVIPTRSSHAQLWTISICARSLAGRFDAHHLLRFPPAHYRGDLSFGKSRQ